MPKMQKGNKMRKITRKGIIRKLDTLAKEKIFERDGRRCVTCGDYATDPGHLFTRRGYSTRWNLINIFPQCRACNIRHEQDPYPLMEYFRNRFGQKIYDDLHTKAKTVHKGAWKTWELEELYNQLNDKL